MLPFSTIAAITYFSVYFLFLIGLSIVVYTTQNHQLDKSFFKSIWQQRKISGQVIVHLYDTASDVGVLITWYKLYNDELNGTDYKSIDMAVLFWAGCSVLAFYRIVNIVIMVFDTLNDTDKYKKWKHTILHRILLWCGLIIIALLDMFIFIAVYESFKSTADIVEENKKRQERRKQKKTDTLNELSDQEIEPSKLQYACMLAESAVESMPQVVLQSVFIIRSANDPNLAANSNLFLVLLSLIASILSISNKFFVLDKASVNPQAKSLKPKLKCGPCIQYWYLFRVMWRFFHIFCRFIIFSLTWIVMGGAFLAVHIFWTIIFYMIGMVLRIIANVKRIETILAAFLGTVGVPIFDSSVLIMIPKWIDAIIMLILISLFANTNWNCSICVDASTRQMNNNAGILIFLILGYISWVVDVIFFLILQFSSIISEDAAIDVEQVQVDLTAIDHDIVLCFLRAEDSVQVFFRRFAEDELLHRKAFEQVLYLCLKIFCIERNPEMPPPTREAMEPFIQKLYKELAPRVSPTHGESLSFDGEVITWEEFKTFGEYLRSEYKKLQAEKNA
eukprot:403304_1